MAIIKTIFVDLFINIKLAFVYVLKPEERYKIKRELEANKMMKLLDERLKRIERLVYAINKDPSYINSNRGKNDLKELKKEIK